MTAHACLRPVLRQTGIEEQRAAKLCLGIERVGGGYGTRSLIASGDSGCDGNRCDRKQCNQSSAHTCSVPEKNGSHSVLPRTPAMQSWRRTDAAVARIMNGDGLRAMDKLARTPFENSVATCRHSGNGIIPASPPRRPSSLRERRASPVAGFNASTLCKSSRSRPSPNCWLPPIAGIPTAQIGYCLSILKRGEGLAALSRGRATRLGRFEAAAADLACSDDARLRGRFRILLCRPRGAHCKTRQPPRARATAKSP